MMTGSATGATTFVLDAIYGADTIANLTSSDIVSMPSSEFTSFTAVSGAASYGAGGAVIKAGDGDTLTLKGITTSAELQGSQATSGSMHDERRPPDDDDCRRAERADRKRLHMLPNRMDAQ